MQTPSINLRGFRNNERLKQSKSVINRNYTVIQHLLSKRRFECKAGQYSFLQTAPKKIKPNRGIRCQYQQSGEATATLFTETAKDQQQQQQIQFQLSEKVIKLLITIGVGVMIYLLPKPLELTFQAWRLLSIFVATIVGVILQPLPIGAVAMMSLGVSLLTNTLSFKQAFAAFSSEIPWLIVGAMFLSLALRKSGLGQRIAYNLVSVMGGNTWGLTYSLVISEAFLAPAIPSVAARAGGIMLPLIRSLSEACGSKPDKATRDKLGSYLVLTVFHTAAVSSAMFITANHPNPLSVDLTNQIIDQNITWTQWSMAAFVPGFVSLMLVPVVVRILNPPQMTQSEQAKKLAQEQLVKLGGMSKKELVTAVALILTVGMWIAGAQVVKAALLGLSIVLLFEVISWDECLGHKNAWNTLMWFGALVGLATQLKQLGIISVFSSSVSDMVLQLGWAWQPSLVVLVLVYFYSHYMFASNLAHVSAMFSAFLSVAVASGAPPLFCALLLAFLSNIQGPLTHYGMSHAPMFFGQGYVDLGQWLKVGLLMSFVNLFIWFVVGGMWWKFLGYW
eukprot:TRINITY_DN9706_c0_g2_i1.p1 TRINITY_DN9706_c0_g2~~TRINITY_DN9706_c0_g2_i1.p1  ORF type:complete len:561 (-),score=74.47 TRINITY_DN9706_c0_g2_i1:677-2359(-)